jgi:hypothetical protein
LFTARRDRRTVPGLRRDNFVGDADVPDLGAILHHEGIERRRQLAKIGNVDAAQAKTFGEIDIAEHRAGIIIGAPFAP